MKTAEVVLHCFILLLIFLSIVCMFVAHVEFMDNPIAREEHAKLYFALTAVTVFNIGFFAFYLVYVWRSVDTSPKPKNQQHHLGEGD